MSSICLFEWNTGGHYVTYLRAIAKELAPVARVTIAASDQMLAEVSDLAVERHSLGGPRPSVGGGDLGADDSPARLAERELRLLREASGTLGSEHVWHLYSDPILRWWLREGPMPARMTATVCHPLAHYPSSFGSELAPRQRLSGWYLEHKVRRWRARSDSNAAFTLDPVAARRWADRGGTQAVWLPEAPVAVPDPLPALADRSGCVFFGAIDARKGFDMFADALALAPTNLEVLVAGHVAPNSEESVRRGAERMRAAGVDLELRLGWVARLEDALLALASARCAVLPYRRHPGTSRVMTEAAAVGTPVVGPDWGLAAFYIREYGLGLAVDPTDPARLREAILELSEDPDAPRRYAAGLRRYTEEVGGRRFGEAVRSAFGPLQATNV